MDSMEKTRHLLNKAVAIAKTYYQHILSAILIIILILIVYGQDLEILSNEALQSEALSHVILIPFFAGFLFYLKKDMIKGSVALQKLRKKTKIQYLDEATGIALCLVAFLIYWYGSHTFYALEYHLMSIPIFIMGITLILFNLKTLTILIFPILFLLFLVPAPTEFMYTLGGAMANFNTQASYTLLRTMGIPVNLTSAYGPPTIVLTGTGQPLSFTIDLPCSGIYSLIAFSMFAAFLALVTLASIPKKISLFALGFLTFEALNIIRITTIVSIGHWFGEEIAMFIFHNIAGLILTFAGMLLILVLAEKILKIQITPQSNKQRSCRKCKTYPEDFCLNCGKHLNPLHTRISQKFLAKLFLLLLGCSIITLSIHAPTFAIAQGTIELTSGGEDAVNVFPQNITDDQEINYTIKFLYRDTDYEKLAHQDASLMYAYFSQSNNPEPIVYVDLGVATSISNLHSWEVCLISWQTAHGRYPLVSVLNSKDIQLLEDTPLIARFLTFESPENYTQVTLYWYEKATFKMGVSVEQRYVRISLIILTRNSTGYQQLEDKLLTFGQHIASYWEPLKTQSLISLGVPAQQLLLTVSIAFVAFTKTAEYSNEYRKKTNNQKLFNNLAPKEEKVILQTILDLATKKKTVETRDIAKTIRRKTRETIDHDKLLNILGQLENYGFIKKDIISVNNKPRLIWKTCISRSYKL